MTPFQLTRTGFVLLGTYFVLTGLVSPMVSAFGTAFGTALALRDSGLEGDFGWELWASALPVLAVMAVPGVVLIAASRKLAERLWPVAEEQAPASISTDDAACLGIALLGLYFAIGGLLMILGSCATALMSGESPFPNQLAARGAASFLVGGLLFFRAHGLARFLTRRA